VNLYLVGYRCTGKTIVGRLLSDAMGWTFVDMDNELVVETGIPIEDIVASKGWEHFRDIEARLLKRLSETKSQVIATGGGVVTVSSNVTAMRATGKVVWLQASPAAIAERMVADKNTVLQRPPLHGQDSLTEIEDILRERLHLYKQAMDFQVDTDGLSPTDVANRILAWFETELKAGSR
jgi:shikimate kinase